MELAVATDVGQRFGFFSKLAHGPLKWLSALATKATTGELRDTPSEVD